MSTDSFPPPDAIPLSLAVLRLATALHDPQAIFVPRSAQDRIVEALTRPLPGTAPGWYCDALSYAQVYLINGELEAYGRHRQFPDGPWVRIHADWKNIDRTDIDLGLNQLFPLTPDQTIYDVAVTPAASVNTVSAPPVAMPEVGTKYYPQELFDNWYKQRVADCGNKGVIPNRDEDLATARSKLPRINREQVRDARRRLAPKSWQSTGLRRSHLK